jgi:NADH:ubiquinone oxidoreductase subunit E
MNDSVSTRPVGSAILDPAKQAILLSALYIAQEQQGYLSPEAVKRVARRLNLTPGQVYSTASFYTLFRTQPVGRNLIQVCDGLSCYLSDGANKVVDYISAKLNIRPGKRRRTASSRSRLYSAWLRVDPPQLCA